MAGVADKTEYENLYDDGGLDAVTQQIKSDLAKSESITLQIAVTGVLGSGKSTFINALRGIKDGDEGAAPIGETETTEVPTMYPYPNNTRVSMWDLPGIGSPKFKASEYLERVKFDRYDFFIILSASRFTENDVCLANEIQQRKKTFYFVRSKIDQDLDSVKRRENSQFNEEKTLEKLQNNCVVNLKKVGIKSPQVFLISSWNLEKFDFEKLQEVLEKDLPALKRRVFLLSLPSITSLIIDKKKEVMLSEIWKVALLSAVVALIPIPEISIACDVPLLVWNLSTYRTDFGLDDGSLRRLAKRVGKMTKELSLEVTSTFGMGVTARVVVAAIIEIAGAGGIGKSALKLLPFIGSVTAAGIAYPTTYFLLKKAIEEMAEDSKRVLAKAMQEMD